MRNVAALAVAEPVSIDETRLQGIVNQLGDAAAGGLIRLTLEQMALAVQALRVEAGGPDAVAIQAQRLSRLAWQVGLVTLAGVAVDIADCAQAGDPVALQATLARMERVAKRSLTEIWENVTPR